MYVYCRRIPFGQDFQYKNDATNFFFLLQHIPLFSKSLVIVASAGGKTGS